MKIADKEINGTLVVSVDGRLTAATEGLFKSEMSGLLTKSDKIVLIAPLWNIWIVPGWG